MARELKINNEQWEAQTEQDKREIVWDMNKNQLAKKILQHAKGQANAMLRECVKYSKKENAETIGECNRVQRHYIQLFNCLYEQMKKRNICIDSELSKFYPMDILRVGE